MSNTFYPKRVSDLIDKLKKLPGLGTKSAERLVLHFLKSSKGEVGSLAENLKDLKETVGYCSICFNLTEKDPCPICSNPLRDKGQICVVESPHDVVSIEKTGSFRGVYHVLLGLITPLEGIGPKDLKIKELIERCHKGGVKEVILATNPSVEGEATGLYIAKHLRPLKIEMTQLARGLPMGSELEFTDEATLAKSFEGRKEI